MVYIQEAHASDAWQQETNLKENVVFASPKGYLERVNLAGTCVNRLSIKIPALVDDFNNSTEIAYTGWPDRLYVIDHEGHIAFKAAPGPYGFKPEKVAETLARLFPK